MDMARLHELPVKIADIKDRARCVECFSKPLHTFVEVSSPSAIMSAINTYKFEVSPYNTRDNFTVI